MQLQSLQSLRSCCPRIATPLAARTQAGHQAAPQHKGSSGPVQQLRSLRASSAGRRTLTTMQAAAVADGASGDRLLVVGPGVLGSYLGKLWLDQHGAGTVVGQTNTTTSHAMLEGLGIQPRTRDAAPGGGRFPHVAFTAPPSGSSDYEAEVRAALDAWDGTGAFVFSSSAAVYSVEDGSPCDEGSPTLPLGASERTDRLVAAEEAVLAAGGCVVRLVGLYHAARGAHVFFLRQGQVDRWGGWVVNLIHYEDAASLCLAALAPRPDGSSHRGQAFIGCDGTPVTFEDMMAAVVASGAFEGSYEFTGAEGPSKGKRMSNPATRQALGWAPKYPSFAGFMAETKGRDWYSQAAAPAGAPHA